MIQSAPAAGGPATVLYDNNGNEIDDGTYLYTFDAMNRLASVSLKSGGTLIATYSYDASGRRIQKVVTNSGILDGTTDYYYDVQQDIEEHNSSGTLTQQYVYGIGINDVLVLDRNLNGDSTATGAGDERLFYYQNALGSVYALADATTAAHILEAYQYDAYGYQTVFDPGPSGSVIFGPGDVVTPGGSSLVGNPFLFTGMMLDSETNLYFDRARYLNAQQGRFISRDPLSYAGSGPNLYAYASDDPTSLIDPMGTQTQCKPRLVSGSYHSANDKGEYKSWRSYLLYVFSASPSNTKLELRNFGWGGAYYGLWYRNGSPKAIATLDVQCYDSDPCKIVGSLTGKIESIDSVVRVYTSVVKEESGDTLKVTVTMGAALNASGGPEVTIGKEGVAGVKMTWPDSTYSSSEAMGTFVWKCCTSGH